MTNMTCFLSYGESRFKNKKDMKAEGAFFKKRKGTRRKGWGNKRGEWVCVNVMKFIITCIRCHHETHYFVLVIYAS
jgi:hypothetical protein